MIPFVRNYLIDNGYIPADHEGGVNIFLGRCTSLQFFLPKGLSYFVKLANINSENAEALERENAALCENRPRYLDLVPKSIAMEHTVDYSLLCVEGIRITTSDLEDIFSLKGAQYQLMQRLLSGEDRILKKKRKGHLSAAEQLTAAYAHLPAELHNRIEKLDKFPAWSKMVAHMPVIPQHGDLAINNIGKSTGGIVVFDWEDYGQITIPGFDLWVMLLSGTGFQRDNIQSILTEALSENAGKTHFLHDIFAKLNIDHRSCTDQLMIHLILFHGLKHSLDYGDDVINNCQRLMYQLIREPIL